MSLFVPDLPHIFNRLNINSYIVSRGQFKHDMAVIVVLSAWEYDTGEVANRRRHHLTAVGEISNAVVDQPRDASSSASSPRPHPTISARLHGAEAGRESSQSTIFGFGARSAHEMMDGSPPASVYRVSNQPRGSPAARYSRAMARPVLLLASGVGAESEPFV